MRGRGGKFKLGRRREANVRRRRRENEGELTSTIQKPAHKLKRKMLKEASVSDASFGGAFKRARVGDVTADSASSKPASKFSSSTPLGSKLQAESFDADEDDERKGDAYSKLLAHLPAAPGSAYARALRARLAQTQGRADHGDGESEEEDVEHIHSDDDGEEEEAVDDEAEDEGSAEGSDEEEEAEEGDEGASADDDDDEDDDEGGAIRNRRRGRNVNNSDNEASGSESESEGDGGEDEDDASSVGVAEPADPFLARYVFVRPEDADADAVAAAAKAALKYAPVSDFTVPAALFGAGHLDTGVAVSASASAGAVTGSLLETLAPANAVREVASASSSSGAAAGAKRAPVLTRLYPPSHDLASQSHVVPKLANTWDATYGAETRAIAARRAKWVNRTAKRLAAEDGAPAPPPAAPLGKAYPLSPLQHSLWGPMSGYNDVYFACRTPTNARELRTLTALHVANHAVKARDLVQRHDGTLKRLAAEARAARMARRVAASASALGGSKGGKGVSSSAVAPGAKGKARTRLDSDSDGEGDDEQVPAAAAAAAAPEEAPEYRDQGFTRPRVLVLLPTRHAALQFVRSLLRLLAHGGGRQIANRNRFFREFSEEDSELGVDWEDDEAELKAAAKALVAGGGDDGSAPSRAVLATLGRRERQMVSEDELSEDEVAGNGRGRDGDGEAGSDSEDRSDSDGDVGALGDDEMVGSTRRQRGSGAGAGRYLYNTVRQGPHGPMRLRRDGGEEGDGDGEGANDDAGGAAPRKGPTKDSDRALPTSMTGRKFDRRGRKRKGFDDSILGSLGAGGSATAAAPGGGSRRKEKAKKGPNPQPRDYRRAFAGNVDDDFR